MFSNLTSSRIARIATSSAVLGTMAVLMFLGAPAEAMEAVAEGRGLV